ncbi:Sensory box histidine kinase/response regulator [hydrothermal vent metagenome]|uniref:histidine kinase n=1 Tax=hydrothermal vent metagenome TaxID=652676 RepID=A0A1W1CMD3_9ZZZZ
MLNKNTGMQIRLYSKYPFPNRQDRKLDTFSLEALEAIEKNQDRPYMREDILKGKNVMRIAVVDTMSAQACVNCHNTRVDTPKKDWKLGDVRGVLEVILPIQNIEIANDKMTNFVLVSLLMSVTLLFVFIYYFSTLQKKHAQILEEKEFYLRKYLLSFNENIIVSRANKDGLITYVSDALCNVSGYSKEELLGKYYTILHHPDMDKETLKELSLCIKEEKEWRGEIKSIKKDGGFYWVKAFVEPEYNYHNKLTGFSSIKHNITALKVKDTFFSNMSHELRTPLNAIIGFVNILKNKISDEEQKSYLEYIGSNSIQLISLVSDILDLSKMESGNFRIDAYEFNAQKELETYVHRFDGLLSSKERHFVYEVSPSIKAIFFSDWLRISQIMSNLLSNAIKFTPAKGEIVLEVSYEDSHLLILVKDNGIGMTQEVQERIFKPFEQADGSTTRSYGGTGLGLSIVDHLVKQMDASLSLVSAEGEGSVFSVSLPIEKRMDIDACHEQEDQISESVSLKGHVLVVEDNKTNQILIRLMLEEFGLKVDIANNGLEALEKYDQDKHNLILMDENMPLMNGIESMKKLHQTYPNIEIPIIALTANAMSGDRERFINEGMHDYLSKPIEEQELLKILRKYL